jgi:hypothetical protein
VKTLLFLVTVAVLVFSADVSLAHTCLPKKSAAEKVKRSTAVKDLEEPDTEKTTSESKRRHETAQAPKPVGGDVRLERYAREVQELARQFARRLQETREFRPDGDKLFIQRFTECHLLGELERKENAIFMQIDASIPPEVASEARDDELRRYLIAQLNLFHLQTLHRMSTRDLKNRWDNSFYSAEDEYPPGVYELLMKNPDITVAALGEKKDRVSISNSVKNIRQLRSVLPTLEQALLAMREHFMAHPPEETELYKKNIEVIGKDWNGSRLWKVSFIEVPDKQAKEGRRCLGFRARLIAGVIIPPFYNLLFFQTGNRFKIGSLFCTEPPCVD